MHHFDVSRPRIGHDGPKPTLGAPATPLAASHDQNRQWERQPPSMVVFTLPDLEITLSPLTNSKIAFGPSP